MAIVEWDAVVALLVWSRNPGAIEVEPPFGGSATWRYPVCFGRSGHVVELSDVKRIK